jgi:hypothetical protein
MADAAGVSKPLIARLDEQPTVRGYAPEGLDSARDGFVFDLEAGWSFLRLPPEHA